MNFRELQFARALQFAIQEINNSSSLLPGIALGDKRQHPTFFRTIPSDHHQAAALARMVKHFGWTWIGAVRSDSDYGNNGMASFLKAAEEEGICVEYSEAYYRTQPRSKLKRVADVIRESTARVVVAFMAEGDMRILLEELSQQPLPPMQWIGSEAWVTDPQMLRFNLCIGAVGFAIPRSVIPGFRNFLLDLSPEQALKFPLLTEFWESSFSCSLKQLTGYSTGMPACDGTEDLRAIQNPYTDTSYLVYKATYAVAHALHGIVCNGMRCDKNIKVEPRQIQGDGSVDFVTVGQYDASQPKGQEFSLSRAIIWYDGSEKVSHYATCACLSDKRQHPTFFRTIPSDHHRAAALARVVKHFGWTWIGTVRSDSDYGNNGMASFLKAVEQEGICVEYSEAYYRTQPRSKLKRVADVICRSMARVIVVFVEAGDMRFLLEQLSQQPPPPMQWIGSKA
ncbi:hypothetical protein G5714_017966 [Onychostoma macrolepis]|uniref:Receptor ligand binding region domain-containing protein n=1 Tax=Onychostoma macrolepis TaxID=369639 RepID=A0A7J6C3H8_9TELE|nr:hypothetical protein G5714_017966 [Onychostoma macrolepis]